METKKREPNVTKSVKKFKIGDIVKWSSQAGGYEKEKHGVVVGIVLAGKEVGKCESKALAEVFDTRYIHLATSKRTEESYLVAVPTKKGKPDKIYWPLTSNLELVS